MHLLRVISLPKVYILAAHCLEVREETTVTRNQETSVYGIVECKMEAKLTGHRPCFRMLQSLLGTCRTDLHHPGHP